MGRRRRGVGPQCVVEAGMLTWKMMVREPLWQALGPWHLFWRWLVIRSNSRIAWVNHITTVKLTSDSGRVQYDHVTTAVGYASASDKRLHFGLAEAREARVEIHWPSGAHQVLEHVKADQVIKVREP